MKKQAENKSQLGFDDEDINAHIALKKLRETEGHVEMMKKRFIVLKVKQEQYQSKTIVHENKIKFHDKVKKSILKDKEQVQQVSRKHFQLISSYKQRNRKLKTSLEEKVRIAKEKSQTERISGNIRIKEQHIINEQYIEKQKKSDWNFKQNRRKKMNQEQEQQKIKISRYKQAHINKTKRSRTLDTEQILKIVSKKQEELRSLGKIEQSLIKRTSNSMEIEKRMKNKLQKIMGDERKKPKFPAVDGNKESGSSLNFLKISI